MSISINPAHARCSKRDAFVSLEQTEGQCRDKHYCNDEACPLEGEFGQNRFGRALSLLAASFGQSLEKPSAD
jgi:hypothetical protein